MTSHASAATTAGEPRRRRMRGARYGRRSITAQLIVFAILLTTLTAALIGTLSYTRARRALEREARSRLALLARDMAGRLHREIEDRVADTTNWARLELMRALLYRDVDKELAQFLEHAVGERKIYRAIVCVGVDGAVIASAGAAGPLPAGGPLDRTRLSITPAGEGRGERFLRLETPIGNPDRPESRIGALVVLLNPQRLLDTIGAPVEPPERPPALVVRSSAGDVVLAREASGDRPPRASGGRGRRLQGRAGVGRIFGADGPDLEVQVTEPASSALRAVVELRATLLKVSLVVLVVGSALGAFVAWRISVPIRRLTESVREIAARREIAGGVVLPRAGGEVGVLAAAFEAMLESLKTAQDEALVQSRRAFLGEIAANVAHEVRTPLSVLKTSAQLLARQELSPPEQRILATNLAAEVDRLNRVVSNLVDLARPTVVRYRDEALAGIVDRAVGFFRPEAAKRGVTIAQAADEGALRIHGSADQLYQVLLNVMQNALQAMPGPGVLGVRCVRDGAWAAVEVTDTGPGFAAEVLAKPFAPFVSTKVDGSGLGLAISKRIVEEHGGTIEIANAPEGGARLRIRLPQRGGDA